MRHVFAIKALDKLPGVFGAHRYLYHCARRKWSFIINDGRRGMLTPIDEKRQCPAVGRLAEAHLHMNSSKGDVPGSAVHSGH